MISFRLPLVLCEGVLSTLQPEDTKEEGTYEGTPCVLNVMELWGLEHDI